MKFRVGKYGQKVKVNIEPISPQRDENGEIKYIVDEKEISSLKDLFALVDNDKTAIVIYPKGIPLDREDYDGAVVAAPLWIEC